MIHSIVKLSGRMLTVYLQTITLLLAASNGANAFSTLSVTPGRTNLKNQERFLMPTTTTFLKSASSTKNEETIETEGSKTIDFDNILQTRRTINSFEPLLPKNWEQVLEKAILSAVHAPNHKRTEPWRFHLLGPDTVNKICELNASIVAKKKGEKAGKKKLERWLQMPGWLVVTCKMQISGSDSDDTPPIVNMEDPMGIDREDYAACCCAVQNLCLSLHNQGMGTKWTTGPVNFDDRFGEIVGFGNNEFVVGTIWFGTPEKVPECAPVKKRSMEDIFIRHG